mgnify:CR=1 FL=1
MTSWATAAAHWFIRHLTMSLGLTRNFKEAKSCLPSRCIMDPTPLIADLRDIIGDPDRFELLYDLILHSVDDDRAPGHCHHVYCICAGTDNHLLGAVNTRTKITWNEVQAVRGLGWNTTYLAYGAAREYNSSPDESDRALTVWSRAMTRLWPDIA